MSLQGMESEPSAFLGTEPGTTLVGRRAIGRKDDMHNASHDDHSRLGADDEQPEQAPHHALNGPGGAPSGPWKTWLDVPLVLRAPEVQLLLNVSLLHRLRGHERRHDPILPCAEHAPVPSHRGVGCRQRCGSPDLHREVPLRRQRPVCDRVLGSALFVAIGNCPMAANPVGRAAISRGDGVQPKCRHQPGVRATAHGGYSRVYSDRSAATARKPESSPEWMKRWPRSEPSSSRRAHPRPDTWSPSS